VFANLNIFRINILNIIVVNVLDAISSTFFLAYGSVYFIFGSLDVEILAADGLDWGSG
jgi:hypothetical protein